MPASSLAVGILEVSRVRLISVMLAEGEMRDGEGERTTEGIRPCFPLGFTSLSEMIVIKGVDSSSAGLGGATGGKVGLEAMTVIVSPSFTAYSFNNLLSASALPFSSSRCEDAGGKEGFASARSDLIDDIKSVGGTGSDAVTGGFKDLKVRVKRASDTTSGRTHTTSETF